MAGTESILGRWIRFRNGKKPPERKARGQIPVYGSNGIIGFSDESNVEGESIVIGRVGAYCGSAYYSSSSCWVTDNAIIAQPLEEGEARFWYYALISLGLNQRSHGSGQPLLNQSILSNIHFEAPAPRVRRAIAATLGALDNKIESNRRAITVAEQLGDALFTAAASESRLLSDVAVITMGSSPKGADLNEDGDGLPFYQGTRDFGVRFPSLRVWTTAPVRTAAKGDTLMSVRAPVGELNRASADCCIGRGVAAIHSDTHPSTLYYAMRNSSSAWDKFQGEGTVFASVNKADVHGAEISWVDDGALHELEKKLRAIDARIESLESETQRLIILRDSLLPELLSGRIRVPAEGAAA